MGNIQKGVGTVGNRNYVGRTKWAQAKYDFAVDGGAISAIVPVQNDVIPSGARVVDAWFIVDTLVTGAGGATVSLGYESAADLKAAATLATAPALDSTGTKRFTAFTSTSNPLVMTADRQLTVTVAVGALTAGVFRVVVEYVEVAT